MMPQPIDAVQLQRLLGTGGQLVEVLPEPEYDEIHIAGAINLPLRTLDARSASRLDRTSPVAVYCHDAL